MRIIVWIALLLSACAPIPLARMPPVSPGVAAAVVMIRADADTRAPHTVTLDGQAIAALPGGAYTRFPVQPGPHLLGVGCLGGWGSTWTEQRRTLLADPRTTYYFSITPTPRCAHLEPVSKDAAQELLARSADRTVESLPRTTMTAPSAEGQETTPGRARVE